jgi:hypothetical protein
LYGREREPFLLYLSASVIRTNANSLAGLFDP